MNFNYLGYTEARELVKGVVSASNQEVAVETLVQRGYRVISLKPVTSFKPNWREMFPSLFRIKPEVIIVFSRQLALLLESGVNIIQCLELLGVQATSRNLKRVLDEVVSDIHRGEQLSVALSKHPESFSNIYCKSLSVGEQTGSLEVVLKQMADYMEKELTARKEIKNALKYPMVIAVVAFVVVVVIVTFVLPAFANLYSLLDVELPAMTRILMSTADWLGSNGLYLFAGIFVVGLSVFAYTKTPAGKFRWDSLALKLPLLGRVRRLDELARCCRSMSLLFRAGLPLPDIMSMTIDSCENRVVKKVLADVRQDMLKGEGLSKPMAKSPLFLPLMVQMVKVGEETGNLDATLTTVAQYFEAEARDKMRALIGFIQPAITLIIGVVVGIIVLSLVSAMYSMYGQVT